MAIATLIEAVMKTEDGASYPAAAFAFVPDPAKPSGWKLRLWESPEKKVTARQVGLAVAAMGKGFRGQKVAIPPDAIKAVKAKVRAAWKKANPGKSADQVPDSIREDASSDGTEMLTEFVNSHGVQLGVNRESGVIAGVKLLGTESKNGRTYPKQVIAEAVAKYDGANVFVNHPPVGKENGPRDYRDRLGVIRNPVVGNGSDGLFGDFHFNPKHALAEQVTWDAEHAPENVGFSHVIQGKTVCRNGATVVEEITRVVSVDLVTSPATTRSMFEGDVADAIASDEREEKLRLVNHTANNLIWDAMNDDDLTLAAKKSRVITILNDWESELGDMETESLQRKSHEKGDKMLDWDQVTEADVQDHLPAIVRSIGEQAVTEHVNSEEAKTAEAKRAAELKTLMEEKETLAKKVDAFEAKEALETRRAEIASELAEAKMPEELATDVFKGTLLEAKDADARKALIKDRMTLASGQAAKAAKPKCRPQHEADGAPAVDSKALMERICV